MLLTRLPVYSTTQKMKFSNKDFFSKCKQVRMQLWIWSHLLNKSSVENFIVSAVFSLPVHLWQCTETRQDLAFLSVHRLMCVF